MVFAQLNGDNGSGDCGSQKPMVELQWYHVAIASVLIIVNGKHLIPNELQVIVLSSRQ